MTFCPCLAHRPLLRTGHPLPRAQGREVGNFVGPSRCRSQYSKEHRLLCSTLRSVHPRAFIRVRDHLRTQANGRSRPFLGKFASRRGSIGIRKFGVRECVWKVGCLRVKFDQLQFSSHYWSILEYWSIGVHTSTVVIEEFEYIDVSEYRSMPRFC